MLFVALGLNAPGVTRTRGQRFRKPLLYPSELQGQTALAPPIDAADRTAGRPWPDPQSYWGAGRYESGWDDPAALL